MKIPKMFNKKSSKDKETQNIAQNEVLIKIYMTFGAEVRQLRATFKAKETKDGYQNLVVVNQDKGFNEDFEFKQSSIYSALNITFDVNNLQKEQAINKIQEKINFHSKRIKALEKHPELNKFANIWDERRKHRELTIFINYIKYRSPNGSYMKVEKGQRVYEFQSIDGFYIPIWHGVDNFSDNPDHTQEKKITMQETANIHNYFNSKKFRQVAVNTLALLLIANIVIFGLNGWGFFKILDKNQQLEDRMSSGAEFCLDQAKKTNQVFNELMQNTYVRDYLEERDDNSTWQEEQSKIKTLLPNIGD